MESGHLTGPKEGDKASKDSKPPAPVPIPIWFHLYLGQLHPTHAKLMLEWLESPLALSAMEGALRNAAQARTPNPDPDPPPPKPEPDAPKPEPPSPPQRVTCEECRFWKSAPVNVLHGECRRRSPLPILASVPDYVACWPDTHKDDWCGEGEPQQSQQPQEPKP